MESNKVIGGALRLKGVKPFKPAPIASQSKPINKDHKHKDKKDKKHKKKDKKHKKSKKHTRDYSSDSSSNQESKKPKEISKSIRSPEKLTKKSLDLKLKESSPLNSDLIEVAEMTEAQKKHQKIQRERFM